MRFFRSGASPEKPEPAGRVIPDPVIPDEADLIKSMLSAYRNPAITSTAALHLDVSARHPAWRVTPRRVRKLLCKVAAQHDAETWVACGEDGVEDSFARGLVLPAFVCPRVSFACVCLPAG